MKRYLRLGSPPSSLEDRRRSRTAHCQQLIDDATHLAHEYRQGIASLASCMQPFVTTTHDLEQALAASLNTMHALQSCTHLLAALVAYTEQSSPVSVIDDQRADDGATMLASVHHLLSSFSDLPIQSEIVETMLAGLRTCRQTMEQAPARDGRQT